MHGQSMGFLVLLALSSPALALELEPLIAGDSVWGWAAPTGPNLGWSIRNGELACESDRAGWFGSQADYTDFVIDFEFRLPAGGRGGLGLRTPRAGHDSPPGLEVRILDDDDPGYTDTRERCGSLCGLEPPAQKALRPAGQWNRMRVTVDSDYILVELNGQTLVDTDGQAHPEIFKRCPRGGVGFLGGSTGLTVRNVLFADLAVDRAERMRWWHQARFGMFVHWGIYAVRGEGEWVMNYGRMPTAEYEKLAAQFNPTAFDPAEWVGLVKRAGASYIVITTKHHDGFAMFDSAASDYDLPDRTPCRKDLLRLLADECARQGIRLGFYHSIADWHHPDYLPAPDWDPAVRPANQRRFDRYLDYFEAQLRELCTNYGPVACIWYDGAADHKEPWKKARFSRINRMIRELQPGILINDRSNRLQDYATPEQFIPPLGVRHYDGSLPAWESCMTITTGHGSFPNMPWWGYDRNETQFKTPAACIRMLVDIASKGGNLLLNVGPDAMGRIGEHEAKAFEGIGEWLRVNGPAVYGTRPSPFRHLPFNGRVTVRDNTLYVHVFEWPTNRRIILPGLLNDVRSARLLSGATTLSARRMDGDWVVELPEAAPDPVVSVAVLELDSPPRVGARAIRPDARGQLVLEPIDADLPVEPGLHFRLEESAGIVHLGRWVDLRDVATWQFLVPRAGAYELAAEYAAEAGNPPGEFRVSITNAGGKPVELRHPIHPTGSPDRFETAVLGRCTLEAGPATLCVEPLRIPKNVYLMSLRRVILVPVGSAGTKPTAAESH